MAGLACTRDHITKRLVGNYEEFNLAKPQIKSRLSKADIFYLKEIHDLIMHKVFLYTDYKYLREFLNEHLARIEEIILYGTKMIRGTTLGELFSTYLSILITYNQLFALFSEIPGKKLTEELKEILMRMNPPVNPFEIEMLVYKDIKQAGIIAEFLGFRQEELRRVIREYIGALEEATTLIKHYLRFLETRGGIEQYFDDKEHAFAEIIQAYGKEHIKTLRKIIETS